MISHDISIPIKQPKNLWKGRDFSSFVQPPRHASICDKTPAMDSTGVPEIKRSACCQSWRWVHLVSKRGKNLIFKEILRN